MQRHLAPSLFALSLCALLGGARAAEAQGAEAIVPATIDSVDASVTRPGPLANADAPRELVDVRPMIRPATPVLLRPALMPIDAAHPGELAALQGRDWKMPTSRTLMIGGTAAALIGLLAVGGDTGAIIAMAGGGVAVYGLYLHYNR
jgi:hypothetical protein